jgi:PTS system galactitol-specific IIB component
LETSYRVLVITGVGTGGWTSKIAGERIREQLVKKGFKKVEVKLSRIDETRSLAESWKPDFVVTIIGRDQDLGLKKEVPVFIGVPFVSAVGMEPVLDQMVEVLKKPHWSGTDREKR